jgi:hypothetical protein
MEQQFIKLMFGYSIGVGILGSLLGLGGGIIMTPFLLNVIFIDFLIWIYRLNILNFLGFYWFYMVFDFF